MTSRLVILVTLFILFSAYSMWVMMTNGYVAIWQAGIASAGAFQILLDLIIACLLGCAWLVQDARKRNWVAWPWVFGVLVSGTLALLFYLIIREVLDAQVAT